MTTPAGPHTGPGESSTRADSPQDVVPFCQAMRVWAKVSLQTFGGPAGQIAVMQRTLVEEKRWIGQQRFNHALSYCMLLPGPEAQQLATYIGWLLNGTRGGLIAGTLFVLPGVLALLAASGAYVGWGDTTIVAGLLAGLAPAVLAIVTQAVIRIARRSLAHPALITIAAAAFAALAVFAVPFPIVIAIAALAGWVLHRLGPRIITTEPAQRASDDPAPLIPDHVLHHDRPSRRRTLKVLTLGLVAWTMPLLAVVVVTGAGSVFTTQGLFFSGTALITFGGAYAVLTFVAHQAVQTFGWLTPGEMVKGLALAETTPGPLIMVVQFVAFVGAYRAPGALDPWAAAVLGALLVTWVTFAPCFLFIFLGAPYVERLRGNQAISAALTGITAAVVGVITNLAVYFTTHTLFTTTRPRAWGPIQLDLPNPTTIQPTALALAAAAFGMIFLLKWSMLRTLGACAVLGLAATLITHML